MWRLVNILRKSFRQIRICYTAVAFAWFLISSCNSSCLYIFKWLMYIINIKFYILDTAMLCHTFNCVYIPERKYTIIATFLKMTRYQWILNGLLDPWYTEVSRLFVSTQFIYNYSKSILKMNGQDGNLSVQLMIK